MSKLANQRCQCHSYNMQTEGDPNVILTVPENILPYTAGRKTVCIDACIADVIRSLWAEGLPTLNSCCGHNKVPPSIVIPVDAEPEKFIAALRKTDPSRAWVVTRWEKSRVGYSTHEHDVSLATCSVSPEYIYAMQAERQAHRQAEAQIVGYFAYNNDDGFTSFDTAERAQKEAEDAIDCYRGDACDGWSDDVGSVCWGVIIQQSTKTGERPVGPDDSVGEHISNICDYVLTPEQPESTK